MTGIIIIFSLLFRPISHPFRFTLVTKGGDDGVKQVVYVDVLVALNIIISFFLIKSVCAIAREKPKTVRVLIGSVMGGAYSLVIFLPEVHIALSIFGRIVFVFISSFAVFGFGSIKRFLRCVFLLCAVSVLSAGVLVAVWQLFLPNAVMQRNGSFYIDVSFVQLVCVCALVYAVVKFFGRFLAKSNSEDINVRLEISFHGKSVKANGIIDTGNNLCDSFTGESVSVISQSLALSLLPDRYMQAAIAPVSGNMPEGMHLIVSDTVSSSALMCAFRADSMTLSVSDKQITAKNATLAVSRRESFGGGVNVLLNSVFINNIQGGRDSEEKTEIAHRKDKTKAEKARDLLHKRSGNSACTVDECAGERGDATHRRR